MKLSCLGPVGQTRIGGAEETMAAAEGQQTLEEVTDAATSETTVPISKVGLSPPVQHKTA